MYLLPDHKINEEILEELHVTSLEEITLYIQSQLVLTCSSNGRLQAPKTTSELSSKRKTTTRTTNEETTRRREC
jgi:hypothetical protein